MTAPAVRRVLIAVHRWLGVALSLLFLVWFPSGIGMMYVGYPEVSDEDRLAHAVPIDADAVRVTPAAAIASLGLADAPRTIQLTTYDNRPVYRIGDADGESVVYADTGDPQVQTTPALRQRVAAAWARQPAEAARVERLDDVDQWTLQLPLRDLAPLWRYTWASGDQVYVSEATGEVVQHTTRRSRLEAWLGPIPHWLYFTPLRRHGAQWSRVVIWTSALATITAAIGVIVGAWLFSPRAAYRLGGAPARIPYRGQKWWHTVFGLACGIAAVTWAFSGMLSMDPFPALSAASARRAAPSLAQALRTPPVVGAFESRAPADALRLAGGPVRQLELATVAGEPVYFAADAGGPTRVVPVRGDSAPGAAPAELERAIRTAVSSAGSVRIDRLQRYDAYYLDRGHRLPLPVLRVELNDPEQTRYYIDPSTARIVGRYSSDRWVTRWLYHGLHSLDVPWLYEHRPLWDVIVIAFMLGGTGLAATSVVLAWRVVGRTLRRGPA